MTIELPLYLQGGAYSARLLRFATAELWDEGVKTPSACKVTQRGAGANFTVDIAVGSFLIAGDDQALQGTYQGRITATENAVIGAAPAGSNKRIDLVTLRVNDPNAGGNSGNTVSVVVVAGTQTTGTPVAPALPASSIPLAQVGPITSATSSITNSIITEARYFAGRKCLTGTLELSAGGPLPQYVPNGWLWCDGSPVSRTTYADLFAVIGTQFGVGNGSTTFNVPDMRGRTPVAYDGATFATIGASGGEVNHTLTSAEMPVHAHTGTTNQDGAHTHVLQRIDGGVNYGASQSFQEVNVAAGTIGAPVHTAVSSGSSIIAGSQTVPGMADPTHQHAFTTNNAGSGGAHNNMQPYQVVSGWLIRT